MFRASHMVDCLGVYALMSFLLQILISCSSEMLTFFVSSSLVCWCPRSILPITCNFPLFQAFFLDLGILFLRLCIIFLSSLWAWHILLCQIPFLYPDCIFVWFLTNSLLLFPFFGNSWRLSMYIRWLIFFMIL